MKRLRSLPWALAAVLMSTVLAQPPSFTLAIVRLDGRLLPFAAYDGSRWQPASLEADEATAGAPSLDSTNSIWRRHGAPVPRVWHVWPASGAKPVDAHVSGVEVVEAHCESQVAFTTDLRAAKGEHPLKFGVAVDTSLPIGSIEEVRRSDPRWRTSERTVLASLSKLEAARAQADRQELPAETPAPSARLTALYREASPRSPRSALYFIGEKKYRMAHPQDPACAVRTILTGWLMATDAGALAVHNPKVFLTDCDEKEVRRAWPIAALHVSGKLFWVLQEHGYEDETYVIAEILPTEVRYAITIDGGGC